MSFKHSAPSIRSYNTPIVYLKMSRALKPQDERELSRLYEAEFNQPDLHDRVLVFDVVASWQRRHSEVNAEENEKNQASDQSEDGIDDETAEIENGETGNQQIENKLSKEGEDDHIRTATNENETTLTDNKESTEIQEAKETEVTNEPVTVMNNVEMNDQHESEVTNDDNSSLNDTEQIGNSSGILSESNKTTSYPTSEGQIVRQHKFYIHSTWLAVQSSYFRSLFFSGMKETNATEVHVKILESEEQAHLMLLKAMYKIDTLDNANVDTLLEVLRLAHKYHVKFVFKKCKYCLQAMVDSREICEKITCFIKDDNTITDVADLASTLQSFLAKESPSLSGTFPCGVPQCETCKFTDPSTLISAPKSTYNIQDKFTCTSTHIIYCISCSACGMLYIGQTKRQLRERFGEHRRAVSANDANQSVARHFNSDNHRISDVKIRALCHISDCNERKDEEKRLISELGTKHPSGINIK